MSLPEGWADGLTEEQIYARGRAELDRLEAEGDAMFAEVFRKALVAFEAKVKARLADPEITWEDEIIPVNAGSYDSIADFKRFERRRP